MSGPDRDPSPPKITKYLMEPTPAGIALFYEQLTGKPWDPNPDDQQWLEEFCARIAAKRAQQNDPRPWNR